MDTSKLNTDLRGDEGEVPYVYQDSLGYWTIGIGFMVDKRKGGKLLPEEIDFILNNRIRIAWSLVQHTFPWIADAPEAVQRAVTNMVYQMGIETFLEFKNTIRLLQARQYREAADNAQQSTWAKQTPNRAKRVTDLIRSAA